jgi:hypothetical protein
VAVLSTALPAPTIFAHFYSYPDKEDLLPKRENGGGVRSKNYNLFLRRCSILLILSGWRGVMGGLEQSISPKYILFQLSEWRVPKRANITSQNGFVGSLAGGPTHWEPHILRQMSRLSFLRRCLAQLFSAFFTHSDLGAGLPVKDKNGLVVDGLTGESEYHESQGFRVKLRGHSFYGVPCRDYFWSLLLQLGQGEPVQENGGGIRKTAIYFSASAAHYGSPLAGGLNRRLGAVD